MRRIALALAALAAAAAAQTAAVIPARDALQLYERVVQNMESTGVAAPGLARAGAPAMENARQALANLRFSPQNAAETYAFLSNLRAYLAVADTVPKPYPMPAEAVRQFADLRDAAERIEAHFRAMLEQKEKQLRGSDRDNLRRYADANAKAGPATPGRVVFLGDSITDGWRLNEYFSGRDFVNRGISGQITGEMLGRMMADVIELKPKAVIVLAGTNDIARGVPLPAIQNNLTMIADLAEFHKIKPLFASLLPVSDYHKDVNPANERSRQRPPATILELNRWIKNFCARRGFRYVDYYSVTVDKAGFFQSDAADDGLHPNAKGYRLMAPVALEAIDAALKPPPEPAKKKRR
ncbi:MAG: GDSL-type esterase/lipase family protein [Bryobacteraceae bacterium]